MFTGVNPGKHGIVDFILHEKNGFVPGFSSYRMCKTVWQVLSEAGRKCIMINDPVTFPPEHINGIMITGLMTPPGSVNWIHPKELRHEIETVAGGYECDVPPDIDSIILKNRSKGLSILENLAEKTFRVSKYLALNFDWDVLAVIFTTTDRLQHFWWDDSVEISRHYHMLDVMLGEYLECAKARGADLLVISDHGFGHCKRRFRINDWLEESGLAVYRESLLSKVLGDLTITKTRARDIWGKWPSAFRALPGFMQEMIRTHVPESGQARRQLDIAKSAAYARGYAGIFVPDRGLRERLAKKFTELTDKSTGDFVFERVMDREEVLNGPYSYRAADLFLLPSLGYDVLATDSVTEAARVGTHRPEGILIHYRSRSTPSSPVLISGPARPWDVGTSILDILGVPIPGYFDGKPIIGR
jgi:predicted AlkP superfamily phosphohydrolase/phosphomutase